MLTHKSFKSAQMTLSASHLLVRKLIIQVFLLYEPQTHTYIHSTRHITRNWIYIQRKVICYSIRIRNMMTQDDDRSYFSIVKWCEERTSSSWSAVEFFARICMHNVRVCILICVCHVLELLCSYLMGLASFAVLVALNATYDLCSFTFGWILTFSFIISIQKWSKWSIIGLCYTKLLYDHLRVIEKRDF